MLPATLRYEIQAQIIVENFTWGHLLNDVGTLLFYVLLLNNIYENRK